MTNKLTIVLALFIVLAGCNNARKITEKSELINFQPYILGENEILKINYRSDTTIKDFFFIDFETYISYYVEKDKKGNTICKGGFDVATYDSTKTYTDQVILQTSDNLGVFGNYIHNFHAMKQGLWYYYYENGKIQIKGEYKHNLKDGKWEYYSPDGELVHLRIYQLGEISKDSVILNSPFIYAPK